MTTKCKCALCAGPEPAPPQEPDIVERLRRHAGFWPTSGNVRPLLVDAIDEIERLRARSEEQ